MARTRRRIRDAATAGLLALGAAFLMTADVASDQVTLTTYYPAPSGVYTQMITTDRTWLARDAGAVSVGTTDPAPPGVRLLVGGGGFQLRDGTQANGRVMTSDVNGRASWKPVLAASNFITRPGARVHGNPGGAVYTTISCQAGEILISGGCDSQDICSGQDTSIYGGYPNGNGWSCPLWHCSQTQAFARCYNPNPNPPPASPPFGGGGGGGSGPGDAAFQ